MLQGPRASAPEPWLRKNLGLEAWLRKAEVTVTDEPSFFFFLIRRAAGVNLFQPAGPNTLWWE